MPHVSESLRAFADYAAGHAGDHYLSLYLLVDPGYAENQSETPAWRVFLRNAIAAVEAGLEPGQTRQWKKVRLNSDAPETAWARTRRRLEKYVTSYRPEGKSLALFISPNGEHRFELPVRLDNASYYGKPHIQELLWALDEYEQIGILLFAQDQTRVLRVALGRTVGDVAVTYEDAWTRDLRKTGHSQQHEWRQDEIDRRYVKQIAEQVNRYVLKTADAERLILGGNTTMANAVLAALHPAVRDGVMAVLPIPITLAAHEVAERAREAAAAAERAHEQALVDEVIAAAAAQGRGATGYTAVERALERGAVRLLALPHPGRSDEVEPLLLQAVRLGATVEFLHDEAAERARQAGGIIAQLHYPLQ